MTAEHISTELLPPLVAELAEVVGHDAAMRLVERYGGWRLYVPATLGDDHELVALIGRAAADRLVERYATDALWLPLCTAGERAARHDEIRRRRAAGERAESLAREYGFTVRHVNRIIAQGRRR